MLIAIASLMPMVAQEPVETAVMVAVVAEGVVMVEIAETAQVETAVVLTVVALVVHLEELAMVEMGARREQVALEGRVMEAMVAAHQARRDSEVLAPLAVRQPAQIQARSTFQIQHRGGASLFLLPIFILFSHLRFKCIIKKQEIDK